MVNKKHVGQSFDDFLEEEDLFEHCQSVAAKRVFVYQLQSELKKQRLTKSELAKKMGTSRAAVSRILNPEKASNLRTLGEVARAVGKQLVLKLV